MRADFTKRLAYLRADQGNSAQVEALVDRFLAHARSVGGREFGRQLVDAGAIFILIENYKVALGHLQQAIRLLPKNGDSYHLSAIHNLARCRFELSASRPDLFHALALTRQAAQLIEFGSFSEQKLRWLSGRIQHRLGRYDESLELLESARQGIDKRGDGYDRALLVLDIAELHLDRRDFESANKLARSSFAIFSDLRKDKEAYKALLVFYRAGVALSVDREIVSSCRKRLLELQRQPRPPER